MRHAVAAFAIAASLSAPSLATAPAAAETWTVDPVHTSVTFSVRHMMVSTVRGEFRKLEVKATFDPKNPTKTTVEATIDPASVDTREPKRDAHLKSADFFDVAKFPAITFKSKKIERAGEGKMKLTGDLTLHGVTKEVTFDVDGPTPAIKDPMGNETVGASAVAKVNRSEFGLKWNVPLANGVLVSDEVTINLEVELKKMAAKK
jgi:polyisoprenoid-binding protein YceI